MTPWLRAPIVLLVGAIGGYLFEILNLPLPWTLGAMAAAGLLTFRAPTLVLPTVFRDVARPVIGVAAGCAFSPEVARSLPQWWPVLLMLASFFLLTSLLGRAFFSRRGLDQQTAFLASSPGGLGEMTILGLQLGADIRALVVIHSIRIVMVVTILPFTLEMIFGVDLLHNVTPITQLTLPGWMGLAACGIIGYSLGRPLRRIGGVMIIPLILSATLNGVGIVQGTPPSWLLAAMQVVIGCITGARLGGVKLAEVGQLVLIAIVWALVVIGLGMTLAVLSASFLGLPQAALFLALAPGGFAEMTVIAIAMNIEVAFVVTCHVFRIFYVMAVSPVLCRCAMRNAP